MLLIALTGGIASGKSLAMEILQELGCFTLDTDGIAHELSAPNMPVHQAIFAHFGAEYFDEKGELDRKKLGDLIFADEKARETLNSITHPIIMQSTLEKIAHAAEEAEKKGENFVGVIAVPLLFEGGEELRKLLPYDISILITADDDIRVKRLMSTRNLDEKAARARINSQMPEAEKAKLADFIITNNGTTAELYEALRSLTKFNEAKLFGKV